MWYDYKRRCILLKNRILALNVDERLRDMGNLQPEPNCVESLTVRRCLN
jgi:hypothetical protein